MGDFNNLDISRLISNHRLKQVVSKPTRGGAILDLIITNIHKFYEAPVITAPLGSSDHNTVIWSPCSTNSNRSNKCIKRSAGHFSRSGINGFGLWAGLNNWFSELGPNPSVDDLTESFTPHVNDALDRFLPMRPIKFHPTDKPWITPTIKLLINERQRAFHSGNVHQWRHYRYKVQREMKKKFYAEKVKQLPTNDCWGWWKLINTMSGRSKSNFSLQRDSKFILPINVNNYSNKHYYIYQTSILSD